MCDKHTHIYIYATTKSAFGEVMKMDGEMGRVGGRMGKGGKRRPQRLRTWTVEWERALMIDAYSFCGHQNMVFNIIVHMYGGFCRGVKTRHHLPFP